MRVDGIAISFGGLLLIGALVLSIMAYRKASSLERAVSP